MPIRPRIMWPALMFATRRTDRVIGRTEILTVSIKTRNGLNAFGAPDGSRLAASVSGFFIMPDKINDAQNGRAKENATARCLVELKTYGSRPVRLLIIRKMNNDTTTLQNPPIFFPNDRKICEEIIDFGRYKINIHREGVVQ